MRTQTSLTATDLLRQRHEQIKTLFDQTIAAEGQARSELFDCLRATLAVHETVEEMFVHPLARSISDAADTSVMQRLEEENEAKQMLTELEQMTTEATGWGAAFLQLKNAVLHHAEAEEADLFPYMDQFLSEEVKQQLADNILTAEPLAPTHPHPHAGENPMALMVVGPFAAMIDRARDHIKKATQR